MLYAAYHFEYPFDATSCFNIGDYIQSLAAIQYLPKLDLTIDRDSISKIKSVSNERIKLIGNSWYSIHDHAHVLPEFVSFLPVSIHINNPQYPRLDNVLNSWANFGPIGCRDTQTLDVIRQYGYEAYFSSCLTTTLSKSFIFNNQSVCTERKGVYFVDVFEEPNSINLFPLNRFLKNYLIASEYKKCLNELNKLIKYYEGEEIHRVTHLFPQSLSQEKRFEIARNLIKKYSTAKLVVTSRIHCALPCLALGTPTVLITKKYDYLRYGGIYNFLNHIALDQNSKISIDLTKHHGELINNNSHVVKAKELTKRCKEFIAKQ